MAGLVLREVLQDIVAQQRWGANAPTKAMMDPTTNRADEVRRVSLDEIRRAARKGVKCRHLGGNKRAPHCSFEETCDGDPCLLSFDDDGKQTS